MESSAGRSETLHAVTSDETSETAVVDRNQPGIEKLGHAATAAHHDDELVRDLQRQSSFSN